MNQKILFFMILFQLLSAVQYLSAQKINYQARWHDNTDDKDLVSHYQYDTGSKIMYQFANDHENLFIYLRFPGEPEQKKVLMFGLTVKIDTTGKKKGHLMVHYPLGRRPDGEGDRNLPRDRPPGNRSYDEFKYKLIERANEMEICGFENHTEQEIIPTHNDLHIDGDMQFDISGALDYSLTIPLRYPGIQTSGKKEIFSVGLESGALSVNEMGNRPGGMSPRGPGPGGGGGFDPQRMAQRRADLEALSVPIKLWVKAIHLAVK